MDKIILPEISVMGHHGLTQVEQLIKQPFLISVSLDIDLQAAAKSDDIADTLNYADLYESIRNEVSNSRFHLIEALAGKIADIALSDERVQAVNVSVEKVQARAGNNVFRAIVVLEKKRDE